MCWRSGCPAGQSAWICGKALLTFSFLPFSYDPYLFLCLIHVGACAEGEEALPTWGLFWEDNLRFSIELATRKDLFFIVTKNLIEEYVHSSSELSGQLNAVRMTSCLLVSTPGWVGDHPYSCSDSSLTAERGWLPSGIVNTWLLSKIAVFVPRVVSECILLSRKLHATFLK